MKGQYCYYHHYWLLQMNEEEVQRGDDDERVWVLTMAQVDEIRRE